MNSIAEIFNPDDLRTQPSNEGWWAVKQALEACREERRPYWICTPRFVGHDRLPISTILLPVSRLEEEQYKAELATYIARQTGAKILLLCANDYGRRARQNVGKMVTRIKHISETVTPLSYEVVEGRCDSDHIMHEAANRAAELKADLMLLTASREYGLDDILFGPAELGAIRRSPVPCLLVNPRDDLFSLCD